MFATASLDRTIKVWSLGSPIPNFTLEGHERGVNCIDYYPGGEKPYLISGADDHTICVWDCQTKARIQVLRGHTNNVSAVCFHPKLPVLLSASEDGTVRVWHSGTYRHESTLNYGLERAWSVAVTPNSNKVAIGYDEGTVVIKLGHEMPVTSMDRAGNLLQAVNNDIRALAIRGIPESVGDGDRIDVTPKDLGACEVFPQRIEHNSNGRFVAVCGDGEFIIYTSKALRNKAFGSALDFGWSASGTGDYAVRESQSRIKVFKNFKETNEFKPPFPAEAMFGGHLLAVVGSEFVVFYDWDECKVVRRIDVAPRQVFWSEAGDFVVLACDDSYYMLSCDRAAIQEALASGNVDPDEGLVEGGFDYLDEVSEKVRTGTWVGDCFLYANAAGRLNYYVGGEVMTLAHLDRPLYMLGFLPKENRVFLMDKSRSIVSYKLLESILEYQTAVVRRDFDTANALLPQIPRDQFSSIARFLESQGFKEEALHVSTDPEQKFDLALQLEKFEVAVQLMKEIAAAQDFADASSDVQLKWKQLGDLALQKGNLKLAEECALNASDFSGILLMYTATGNREGVENLASQARSKGRTNIAFLANFVLGRVEDCIEVLCEAERIPEAAFMARTYMPSLIPQTLERWKADLARISPRAAEALADPSEYPDLFPTLKYALRAEAMFKQQREQFVPATKFVRLFCVFTHPEGPCAFACLT